LVIKELKGKEKKNLIEIAKKFLEEKFEVKEGIKEAQIAGGEGKEMVIIQMDSWERKEEIMRGKKKLGSRKFYIDNDLTQKQRGVQMKLREIAREKRADERKGRIGYRKIEIEGQLYVRSEEDDKIVKKKNF